MTHPTKEELDALVNTISKVKGGKLSFTNTPNHTLLACAAAIRALREQLAEVKQLYEICKEQLHYASRRADRAEANARAVCGDCCTTCAVIDVHAEYDQAFEARLAKAEADLQAMTLLKENYALMKDRAEAERAAQIEADAKTCDRIAGNTKDFNAETRRAAGMCASAIRAQTHDRSALGRMLAEAREKALREAIEAYPKGIEAILALIENKSG